MSAANVKSFLALCDTRVDLRDKVRGAKNNNRTTMLNSIAAIGSAEGLAFTAAEYESVVASEVDAVLANHRSIFHHHVINVG